MTRSEPVNVVASALPIGAVLSLYASSSAVSPGQPFRLYGSFLNYTNSIPHPLTSREIALYRNNVDTGLRATTDSGGAYSFTISEEAPAAAILYFTLGDGVQSNLTAVAVTQEMVPTTISITTNKTTLSVGDNAIIEGTLVSYIAIKMAKVHLYVDGVDSGLLGMTDDVGHYIILFPQGAYTVGTYTLDARFLGDAMLLPSQSSPITITIGAVQTTLSIQVSPTQGGIPLQITVSGYLRRVSDNMGVQNVTVNLLVNGEATVATTTDQSGYYTISYTLSTIGSYIIETEFPGTTEYLGCEEVY